MGKSPDAFRSIGEVSRLVGVAPHVLRYWETQFSQLSPVKRSDGRRYYRPDDVRLVAGLCQVLREDGLSIRGAKRMIQSDRGAGLRRIGAARLGETSPGPAETPFPVLPAETGPPAEILLESPPIADGGENALTQDRLGRLCTTAQALRALENDPVPLPDEASALLSRLNSDL